MELVSNFKTRLNYAMNIKGISQKKLSKLTGIHQPTISKYVLGKYEPKIDKLNILAKALNVDTAWLVGYDVQMERLFEKDVSVDDKKEILITSYNSLDEKDKDFIIELITKMSNKNK